MCEIVHAYASESFAVNEGSKTVDTRTVWAEDQSLAAVNVSVPFGQAPVADVTRWQTTSKCAALCTSKCGALNLLIPVWLLCSCDVAAAKNAGR